MYMNISIYSLTAVSFLTWLVFVLTAAKIYKFFKEFEKFKAQNDVELNSMVWSAKKVEEKITKIVVELQSLNQLLYDVYRHRPDGTRVGDTDVSYPDEDILRHKKTGDNSVKAASHPEND